jgi:molybdopterin converting factor small subunit
MVKYLSIISEETTENEEQVSGKNYCRSVKCITNMIKQQNKVTNKQYFSIWLNSSLPQKSVIDIR